MALTIRQGEQRDADAMFEVERAAALVAFADVFPADRYPYPDALARARWRDALRGSATVLIAERDGIPAGFASVTVRRLDALFVLPSEWGQGVADDLYDEALHHLRQLGRDARLWVQEANERARRFYERRGWQLDGRRSAVPHSPYPILVGYRIEFRRE